MHAKVNIVTSYEMKTRIIDQEGRVSFQVNDALERVMFPYCEYDFYHQYYDEELGYANNIPPEAYPEFLWDYYKEEWSRSVRELKKKDLTDKDVCWDLYPAWTGKSLEDLTVNDLIGCCYVLINKNGIATAKEHWNGKEIVDQKKKFASEAGKICRSLKDSDWITQVDIHW